jgi:hypothetical protein
VRLVDAAPLAFGPQVHPPTVHSHRDHGRRGSRLLIAQGVQRQRRHVQVAQRLQLRAHGLRQAADVPFTDAHLGQLVQHALGEPE